MLAHGRWERIRGMGRAVGRSHRVPLITDCGGTGPCLECGGSAEVRAQLERAAANLLPLRRATFGLLISCSNYNPNFTCGMLIKGRDTGICSLAASGVPGAEGLGVVGHPLHLEFIWCSLQ